MHLLTYVTTCYATLSPDVHSNEVDAHFTTAKRVTRTMMTNKHLIRDFFRTVHAAIPFIPNQAACLGDFSFGSFFGGSCSWPTDCSVAVKLVLSLTTSRKGSYWIGSQDPTSKYLYLSSYSCLLVPNFSHAGPVDSVRYSFFCLPVRMFSCWTDVWVNLRHVQSWCCGENFIARFTDVFFNTWFRWIGWQQDLSNYCLGRYDPLSWCDSLMSVGSSSSACLFGLHIVSVGDSGVMVFWRFMTSDWGHVTDRKGKIVARPVPADTSRWTNLVSILPVLSLFMLSDRKGMSEFQRFVDRYLHISGRH